MTGFHPLENYGLKDLAVRRLIDHPIWAGVSENDLTFRRGVAGFYGRAWHEPPHGATVVHALGTPDRPLDFIYRVGKGRVLFHGGNDLWQYDGADSAGRIAPATPALDVFRGGRFVSLAILDGGAFYHHATIYGARYRDLFDRSIYMPELTPEHLEGVKLLIVPDRINPDLLRSRRQILIDFAERGGTLVVLGENQAETWLPGVNWTSRPTNFWWWLEKDAKPEQRLVCPDHEFFQAVPFADTIWHFHGVLEPAATRANADRCASGSGRTGRGRSAAL